jgi:protocatechuate 3,4-dioxygenase beta subunit
MINAVVRPRRFGAALPFVLIWLLAGVAGAQAPEVLEGRVVDEIDGSAVTAAAVTMRALGEAPAAAARPFARRAQTDGDGRYRFDGVPRGSYALRIERFGYRIATVEVTLDRDQPLFITIRLEVSDEQ